MKRAALVVVALLALAAWAVTAAAPGWFGLADRTPWAQLVMARGGVGVLAAAGGVAAVAGWAVSRLVAGIRRRRRSRRDGQPSWSGGRPRSWGRVLLVGYAAVQVAFLAAQLGVLAARGTGTDPLPTAPEPSTGAVGPAGPDRLTVVVANTYLGRAEPGPLAALAARVGADVVALPEAGRAEGDRVRSDLAGAGLPVALYRSPQLGQVAPTTLLVADRLGTYRQVGEPDGGPGSLTLAPVGHAGPLIAAAHPFPPLGPGRTATWRARLAQAVAVCGAAPDVVLAGDLNATVDHPALAGAGPCVDAASERGAAGAGTWPAAVPGLFGAALDHVLATGDRWHVESYSVAPLPGSDHRAVVVRLRRR